MSLLAGTSSVQLRIQGDLVDLLESCQSLRGDGSRLMLVDLLSDAFDEVVSLRSQVAPRMQLLDLVRTCTKQLGGLQALLRVIALLEPQAPEIPGMIHLCDEWEAMKAFPTNEWNDLRDTLSSVRLADDEAQTRQLLRTVASWATEGRVDLPSRCDSMWSAFLYLAGANAAADSIPPAMIFLDCMAERLSDPYLADRIRDWNREWAERFGVTGLLNQGPWRASNTESQSRSVHLVIQLAPDPHDHDSYMLSHFRHWDALGWRLHRAGDVPVARSNLEREIDRVISELETELGAASEVMQAGQIFLEFVVPWEMLNTPIQFWRKSSMSRDTVPLAVDHPVVLRSLDRMRAKRHRLAWKRRWSQLSGRSVENRPYWSQPSGHEYFTKLAAELSADEQIVSLVLSEPPGDRRGMAWREVAMAFRAGIPAILWDREDCAAGRFRDAVTEILKDGAVGELPQRVADLRREALRLGANAGHAGHTITILFDDADRLPEPPGAWQSSQTEVTDGA